MKIKIFFLFFLFGLSTGIAQDTPAIVKSARGSVKKETGSENDKSSKSLRNNVVKVKRALHSQYQIFNVNKDTILIDTSLTIQKDYKFNLLRKDIFGLLPFANDGHTYNTLDFNQHKNSSFPQAGFRAKHFNYLQAEDIKYYKVATPYSDLYFKTVLGQGQSLDAW